MLEAEMRYVRFVAYGALLVGIGVVISMVIKVLSVAFRIGPVVIDFSPSVAVASIVLSALIVSLILLVLLDYVPGIIRGEEEV